MPYALVPEGYTLKKVTKQQQDAITSQRRHEDLKAALRNPNTPLVLGAVVVIPALIAILLEVLEDEGVNINLDIKDKLVKLSPAYWLFKAAEFGTAKGVEVGSGLRETILGEDDESFLDTLAKDYASYITGKK